MKKALLTAAMGGGVGGGLPGKATFEGGWSTFR